MITRKMSREMYWLAWLMFFKNYIAIATILGSSIQNAPNKKHI